MTKQKTYWVIKICKSDFIYTFNEFDSWTSDDINTAFLFDSKQHAYDFVKDYKLNDWDIIQVTRSTKEI